ncbi:MAG TPA: FxsA family protein, partial [Euzebya sp.]|nr:FxsA family protein [Euzebya sp.]
QVQQFLGWPTTILILVLDSVLGAYLVRSQGTLAWRRFNEALGQARLPAEEVVDGALILFGGALLLTPGFLTDFVGLSLVFPPTRKLLNRLVRSRVSLAAGPVEGKFSLGGRGRRGREEDQPEPPPPRPGVIDVEVIDVRRTPESGERGTPG